MQKIEQEQDEAGGVIREASWIMLNEVMPSGPTPHIHRRDSLARIERRRGRGDCRIFTHLVALCAREQFHRAAVEPREILKDCLLRGASGVALFHTHPSGDPTPSAEDLLFTRRMAEAAEVIGVELVDHLVLGAPGRWVSLRERGAW